MLGIHSVLEADLWGLFHGLNLAWTSGIRALEIECDFACMVEY